MIEKAGREIFADEDIYIQPNSLKNLADFLAENPKEISLLSQMPEEGLGQGVKMNLR